MEKSDVVEEFFGVYLLKCLNPKYEGRTYIGYTVDPNRRIKQHNKGKLYGGAWRTSQKGPWQMILTVHGFPSDVAALRFEWAWQHPTKSRRLKSVITKKKSSESSLQYCLKVMFTMLRVSPWSRLPLTMRWLSADVMVDPPPGLTPPVHMPIVYGPVVSRKVKSPKKKSRVAEEEEELCVCRLCGDLVASRESLSCLSSGCPAQWHIVCLAKHFLARERSFMGNVGGGGSEILPVEGCCEECGSVMLWGDLIRKKKGCYNDLKESEHNLTDDNFFYSSTL